MSLNQRDKASIGKKIIKFERIYLSDHLIFVFLLQDSFVSVFIWRRCILLRKSIEELRKHTSGIWGTQRNDLCMLHYVSNGIDNVIYGCSIRVRYTCFCWRWHNSPGSLS